MSIYPVCLCPYSECLESSLGSIRQAGWECNQECTSEITGDRTMKGI
jgi:hypothetical protein